MNLDPALVTKCINNLLVQYPELWDDEDARELAIESETDTIEYLSLLEQKRQEEASMAGAIASRIAQLEVRLQRYEAREKACRKIAFEILRAAGLQKVTLPEATLSISKGRERVVINDESSVPVDLCHPPVYRPDLKRISEAIKADAQINWAAIVQSEPSLSVRTK
jgi:hypothetical protein